MLKKIIFGLIWLSLIVYAFFLAPPNQPNTTELIINLSTGHWEGINPLVIALFNIMGVWPLIYCGVLFVDGQGQKLPAWLFVTFSFGVGAFAILPYLALREPNPNFSGEKTGLIKVFESRITGIFLLLGAIALVTYGISQGNWTDFIYQWQTSRFIHVMSLDFCLLCLLFPTLLSDDMARRGIQNQTLFWIVSLIPLFGAVLYLIIRDPLLQSTPTSVGSQGSEVGISN